VPVTTHTFPVNRPDISPIVALSGRTRIPDFLSRQPQSGMLGNMSAALSRVGGPSEDLIGRDRERAALDRLLQDAGESNGGALALHGEPGVGKTALLE
jgi:hypothetical protein